MFEQAGKNPLRPAVVIRAARAHLPAPIVAETQQVQLAAVAGDVAFGRDGGVLAGLDGILLRGQAEAVIALGVQDIEPALALVPRDDVRGDVAERVSDMEAGSTRVREHVEDVVLGLVGHFLGPIGALFRPLCPPLGLDGLEVVFHCPAR